MKSKKIKIFLMIVISALCLWGLSNFSYAAYVNVKASASSANPGEKVSLTISSDCIGRVNLSVSNGSLGADKVWIEGANAIVDVTVGSSGKTVITATPEGGAMSSGGEDVPVSSSSVTIEINGGGSSEPEEPSTGGQTTTPSQSSNANLSNLGIRPNDFTGFKAGTTKYYVTVENDVEEVSVYANPQDAKATVSGVGRKKLKEGSNPLSVVVTAEDGTKKTYTIYVTRKTADEATVPNVVDEPETPTEEKLRLTAIALQEDLNLVLNPVFNSEVFEYTLEVGPEIEAIEVSGVPNINDAKVTISGNEELVEGENTITLKVSKTGMEDVTYKIKVTKKAKEVAGVGMTTTYHSTMPKPFYVAEKIEKDAKLIMYLAIAITVVGIGVCTFEYAKNRNLAYADGYDDDEYEDEEYEAEQDDSWKQMNSREEMRADMEREDNIQGRTVDLISPDEWEEEEKPRRKKGKHF